nr:AAA family ATPase [Pseudenhygromyxa sp. WMMC2535]
MSAPTTPASPDQPDQANELDQLDRDIDAVGELDYETLAARSHALRERLNRFRTALGHYFVERQSIIDLMTICAIAQEPLLLVGVPGTAKSDLVTKFRDALGIPSEDYFEYMLTRFTEPSEVMGPIDINLLREGRYIRRAQGKLPTARMVFLDEIFKSNSAILNSLLTIINERKFYQDGTPVPVALEVLIAATNEIPEHAELAALKDRFCLKIVAHPVQDEHFFELIDAGLDAQTQRDLAQKPWVEGHASLVDLLEAHRYLSLQMARRELMADGQWSAIATATSPTSCCASCIACSRPWPARTACSSAIARSSSSTSCCAPGPGCSTAARSSARTSPCSPTWVRPARSSPCSRTRSPSSSASTRKLGAGTAWRSRERGAGASRRVGRRGLLLQRGASVDAELLALTAPWLDATTEVLALLPPLGVVGRSRPAADPRALRHRPLRARRRP